MSESRLGFSKPYAYSIKKCKKLFKRFGKGAEFRKGAFAVSCENISIGENVVIRTGCMLFGVGNIIIEDNVLIGNSVHIYTTNHKHKNKNKPIIEQGFEIPKQTILKKGCWVGSYTVILAGVVVGENAVIGAGSIVTKSVPKGETWVGNPAKKIRKRRCG